MPKDQVAATLLGHIKEQMPEQVVVRGRTINHGYKMRVISHRVDYLERQVGEVAHVVLKHNQLLLRRMEDDGSSGTPSTQLDETPVDLTDPTSIDKLDAWLRGLSYDPSPERQLQCVRELRKHKAECEQLRRTLRQRPNVVVVKDEADKRSLEARLKPLTDTIDSLKLQVLVWKSVCVLGAVAWGVWVLWG